MFLVCPSCEREVPSANDLRPTPKGQVICDECAVSGYVDVPLY